MSAPRAERLHRSLSGLVRAGRPLDSFAEDALSLLGGAVRHDVGCLATTDPATGLVTRTFKVGLPDHLDAEVARFEYEVDDVNLFRDLVHRPSPVGVLEVDTGGRPERSARWRELLVPQFGQAHELRSMFRSGEASWGLLAVFRPPGRAGFSTDEAVLVGRVAGLIGAGLRAALVASTPAEAGGWTGPAVLVIGADDGIVQLTAAGERRLAELGGAPGSVLPLPLLSVVAAARAFAAGRTHVPPRLRVRAPSGQFLVVSAAPLASTGAAGRDVVLSVEEARPPDIVPLVVAAFGLTERERDVVHQALRGADTQEIARRLYLSPYTVQDHLKSIFDKAGVRSRRELVSRIFLDQYAPRLGSALDPSGWFRPGPR
ncbi:helix-turn-helix transcriptional regulator [Geodermatophilus sp. YIM 151500]|uniref:response regulator transcription factor n=1 Tax=Geodermatophilus sp. YIM 151500 TaxID=2984531 RepID=UPI0021E492DB|nr:helix-turn-helix transcriptional regulator [Geodermatophilus sp. YIM 151500]MCV2491830.1 helix-turn-helix transcriptional regulator [Geodermatophilus sp. YIM 151500]